MGKPAQKSKRIEILPGDPLEQLSQFARTIAHEVNTPLSTILFLADNIINEAEEDSPDLEDIKAQSEQICTTVETISQIIKSLRAYVSMDFKKPFLKAKLKFIVNSIQEMCHEKLELSDVKLNILPYDTSIEFHCRNSELIQVFVNLIKNSVDAIDDLDEKWINLKITEKNENLIFEIVDSGKGVAEEFKEQIFEPFFSSKGTMGMGLGLAISKAIIEAHGGHINVDEENGHTRFTIDLPKVPKDPFLSKRKSQNG